MSKIDALVDEALARARRYEDGLKSLKGEEEVNVGSFRTTRIISYPVLNRKIDAILAQDLPPACPAPTKPVA